MKISLNWLNEYVDVKDFFAQPEKLAALLTGAGLEVEGYDNPAKNFDHVVIGQILELGKHPNADKLTLCQVSTFSAGAGGVDAKSGDTKNQSAKTHQIVCGAKNHKQGDKVVVALPGAVLPGNFAIKLSKIRDVESQGMLCSETELGLNTGSKSESAGIIIVPGDTKIGISFAEYAGLKDIIFEINVTPNRADCLSHIGLAREVACLLDRKIKVPSFNLATGSKKVQSEIEVTLSESELCPRYCGRMISKVKVAPSPEWLKQRLQAVGINSINNIVDVTNFVMLEYGQPLHAFDLSEISDKKLNIKKSVKGEKFKSFDGTEIELSGEELTIRDGKRVLALAGIVGGLNSGVKDQTTEIFLEAAHFNPKTVRRTARKFGIDTDSSQRFSRGTDPEHVLDVMNRAAFLIQQVAGGEISKDFYDLYPKPIKRDDILVRKSILETRLGYKVELSDFSKWMTRLQCSVSEPKTSSVSEPKTSSVNKSANDNNAAVDQFVKVTPPPFRFDLDIEMDLVEEYARLNGYDKIPETFSKIEVAPTESSRTFQNENHLANLFVNEGFFEAKNYNFVSPKWQKQIYNAAIFKSLGLTAGEKAVDILNPLSEETSQMRQSLLPGLLSNLIFNYHHGMHFGRLFEVGSVFGKSDSSYVECQRVAGVLWGSDLGLWNKQATSSSDKNVRPVIYDLKSAIEGVVSRLNSNLIFKKESAQNILEFVHAGQVASLFFEGKIIGFVGSLHPAFKDEHKIREDVAVFEIDAAVLMRGYPRPFKVSKISKFQAVERDIAMVLPVTLDIGEVIREIKKAAAPLLQSVEVFDLFRGGAVPEGHQSVAFRYVLQSIDATLSDAEILATTQKILTALEKKFSIKIRSS